MFVTQERFWRSLHFIRNIKLLLYASHHLARYASEANGSIGAWRSSVTGSVDWRDNRFLPSTGKTACVKRLSEERKMSLIFLLSARTPFHLHGHCAYSSAKRFHQSYFGRMRKYQTTVRFAEIFAQLEISKPISAKRLP
ncbi:hypothetical protein T265_08060 [Opisthorchis viverrini]|uniref:Uncharacterized protein n=1 Tax=Opisthorchis viverrini TaxID=6198 RepID=A0A075A9M9_OPIVI|nr:hypothetical protein T265_08060 [Opisthorchis viverrini]KER24214.1 hypothetical protein T265_08060 [Opisthorchis viverrini]